MHFYPNYLPLYPKYSRHCSSPLPLRLSSSRGISRDKNTPPSKGKNDDYDEKEEQRARGNGEIVIPAGRRLILRAAPVRR